MISGIRMVTGYLQINLREIAVYSRKTGETLAEALEKTGFE